MGLEKRILFLCTGASCRSQMALGWLRHHGGGRFVGAAAGTRPQGLNPMAVRVMREAGVDIADQRSEDVRSFLGDPPDVVVVVCDRAAEDCPAFPGATKILWPFEDPAGWVGPEAEALERFRRVRDLIGERVAAWIRELEPALTTG